MGLAKSVWNNSLGSLAIAFRRSDNITRDAALVDMLVWGSPTDERMPSSAEPGVVEIARSAAERGAVPPNKVSSTCSCPVSAERVTATAVGSSAKSGGTTSGAARATEGPAAFCPRMSQSQSACPTLPADAQPDNVITVTSAAPAKICLRVILSSNLKDVAQARRRQTWRPGPVAWYRHLAGAGHLAWVLAN